MTFKKSILLFTATALGTMALTPTTVLAQVTIPSSAASAAGNSSSATTGGVLGTGNFTNLYMINSTQLSSAVGQVFKGFRVRVDENNVTGTFPSTNLVWTNFNVTFAKPAVGLTLANFNTTFGTGLATDYLQNPLLVRSGGLTINQNSFTDNGSTFNPFGPLITLPTEYAYTGGDLMIYITHGTATGTGFTVDATSTDFGYTLGSSFAQRNSSSFNSGATNATTAAPVLQLEFGPATVSSSAPEPGTLALLALGGAAVLAKRRRRQA